MAYTFSNQQKASATYYKPGDATAKFKLAGVNGLQTSAENFNTAITGLLAVVGLTASSKQRDITQVVTEDSP